MFANDYGLLISKQYTGLVIFTQGQWYLLKPEFNLVEHRLLCHHQ